MRDSSSRARARRTGLLVLVLLVVGGLVAVLLASRGDRAPDHGFTLGATHTQFSADLWNPPDAVQRAEAVLREVAPLQNQHLMGWGAENPEPSPGRYDWASLDARVDLMRRTGSTMVLTLCCAPDWMKGGEAGSTDWSRLEVAPSRDRYEDFAALAAAAAVRYRDITYFQVWNELKGFFDPTTKRWRYEDYTDLYNAVYAAVKQVRPDAKVGGPYVVIDSWSRADTVPTPSSLAGSYGVIDQRSLDVLDYWLEHKIGADFVSVDGSTTTKDKVSPRDPVRALEKFAAVNEWLRDRTDLPIWWSEFYVDPGPLTDDQAKIDLVVSALDTMRESGAAVALLWSPNGETRSCTGCLFTDVRSKDGGRASPLATALAARER